MLVKSKDEKQSNTLERSMARRSFIRYAGASTAIVTLAGLSGCHKDNKPIPAGGVDLGSGDIGILNYAYSLEQLEAAFYVKVISSPYSGMSDIEKSLFTDIRDHEIAHREFFKSALKSNAVGALEVDFSSIDFSSRDSVLATAKAFEDLGVSAYNGAGSLLTTPDYLALAGKIVSVEARHAAYIRDLVTPDSFAGSDVVDANGLDMSRNPSDVLKIAGQYIKTKIDASHLPTN